MFSDRLELILGYMFGRWGMHLNGTIFGAILAQGLAGFATLIDILSCCLVFFSAVVSCRMAKVVEETVNST